MGRVYTDYSFDSVNGYLTINTDVSDYYDDSYVEAYWEDNSYFHESFYDSTSFSFEFDVWDGGVFAHDISVENDFTGEIETYSEDYHVYVYASAGQSINGSGIRDIAFGSDFNDVISLGAANDDAFGGAGNDYIDGGSGADVMQGQTGNDIYIVSSTSDRTIEYAGQGTDIVRAFTHWTLSANIERLELQGTANLVGTGNSLNNTIVGNSGANTLRGAAGHDYLTGGVGADTAYGGTGNDTYVVTSTSDRTIELAGEGSDVVRSSVNWTLAANTERLELQGTTNLVGNGNSSNNALIGNGGTNVLRGAAGNDYIVGGAGKDTLVGGSGNDTFFFNAAFSVNNIDKITDYNPAQDTLQVENAIFTGLAAGWLAAAAFHIGNAAHDANDRIIYNSSNGDLLFDRDGTGSAAAMKFATLSPGLAVSAGDFFVV